MKLRREDSSGFGLGTMVFTLFTIVLALAALFVAGEAWSRSNDAKDAVAKLAAGGVVPTSVHARLQEFSIAPTTSEAKAGTITFVAANRGSITHELVVIRAASVASLPLVTTPGGERAVGAVDEEAISAADTIGETGDVKAGTTATKRLKLTPGSYVVFCNIDNKAPDGTVTNHFQSGMSATLTVR
jgi:plastocyanin